MTRSRVRTLKRGALRTVLLTGALIGLAAPAALADTEQSSNWAGYAVHRSGVEFKQVLGTWRQPDATCTAGIPTYSSAWVGLGGYSTSSQALEQIGSEVDCNARGQVESSVWYELVPDPSRTVRMTVRPGDELRASVSVTGHQVMLELRDLTRGTTFSKRLHAESIDISSAEWILEAPSDCSSISSCQTLPLANFGSASFTGASATTTSGISGAISDRHWGTSKITLATSGRHFIAQGGPSAFASASPSSLSGSGSSFTVTYRGSDFTSFTRRASVRAAALVRSAVRRG
jgi:hypothetical protein